MKSTSWYIFFFLLYLCRINNLEASNVSRVISSSPAEIVLEINFPNTILHSRASSGTTDVVVKGASVLLQKTAPALPYFSIPLELDASGEWLAEITDSVYTDIPNIIVTPSRGNLKRNQDIKSIPFIQGNVYQQSSFFPASALTLTSPYIMRSARGMAIQLMAARYQGASQTLRTYQKFVVKVKRVSSQGLNPLPAYASAMRPSLEWNQIIRRHFVNEFPAHKYNQSAEDGAMLIICHSDTSFVQAMQPFVQWKTQRGIKVDMISYAQVGGTAVDMKSYIQSNFAAQQWSFILIVGDAPQIPPAYITSGPSDQWFGDVVGNDHYTDILVGRFSAENVSQLNTQVRRSIWYEKEMTSSANYLSNALGIGSDEGPGDDNQMDWEHQRGILTQLSSFTYQTGFELYDGAHGGNDAPGNPVPSDLAALVNDGIGIINYTGHGGNSSFVTTSFSNADANSLNNIGKLPFIYSVACVNGEFQAGTCFAEAWLRSEVNGSPTGAVATLMSTINQSWNPPMEGQDEMNAILTESITGNIKRTFAGIGINGCLKMNDSYGAAGAEMTDTWTVFGDPSLLIRTTTPMSMQVSHALSVPFGISQMTVSVNIDSAMVAITQNGVLLGASLAYGGQALVTFSPLISSDSLLVTVTGFNQVTYQGMVEVTPVNAPYVVMAGYNVQDPMGNNNQLVDYGEMVEAVIDLGNIGLLDAQNISIQISTNDSLVLSYAPSTFQLNQLNAGAQSSLQPIQIQTDSLVPDGHQVVFDVQITFGTQVINQNLAFLLHAPVLSTEGFSINDQSGGNGNGRLDAGETATVTIQVLNSGSSVSPVSSLTLASLNPNISLLNPTLNPGVLAVGSQLLSFTVMVGQSDTLTYRADFNVNLVAGPYQHQSPRQAMVNQILEDFESNSLLSWDWAQQGNAPWFTTNSQPFEGIYCSESGNIDDNQSTSLLISLNVVANDSIRFARRVSCEQDWDFLRFFVDNNLMGEWTGNLAWQQFAYPVSPGQHVFRWSYEKDSYLSDFSDCAWIDEVIWPAFSAVVDTNSTGLIVEESAAGNLMVFPNPGSDFFSTTFVLSSSGEVSAKLFDASGRLVRVVLPDATLPAGRQNLLFSLSDVASGTYFLRLTYPGGVASKRVIVKK